MEKGGSRNRPLITKPQVQRSSSTTYTFLHTRKTTSNVIKMEQTEKSPLLADEQYHKLDTVLSVGR